MSPSPVRTSVSQCRLALLTAVVAAAMPISSCVFTADVEAPLDQRVEVAAPKGSSFRGEYHGDDGSLIRVTPLVGKQYLIQFYDDKQQPGPGFRTSFIHAAAPLVPQGGQVRSAYIGIVTAYQEPSSEKALFTLYFDPATEVYVFSTLNPDKLKQHQKPLALAAMRRAGLATASKHRDRLVQLDGTAPTLSQVRVLYSDRTFAGLWSDKESRVVKVRPLTSATSNQAAAEGIYTDAPFISPAEFLNRVKQVRITLETQRRVFDAVPEPELRRIVQAALSTYGISETSNAAIELKVVLDHSQSTYTTYINDRRNRQHQLHGLTAEVKFITKTPVFRAGAFRWLEVAPASSFASNGWSTGSAPLREGIMKYFPELLAGSLEDLSKWTRRRTTSGAWNAASWPREVKDQINARFTQSTRNPSAADRRVFAGFDFRPHLITRFDHDATRLVDETKLRTAWQNAFARVGLIKDQPGLIADHRIVAFQDEATTIGRLVGFGENPYYVLLDHVELLQQDVVYEIDGQFVRGDVSLWSSFRHSGSLPGDVSLHIDQQISKAISEFVTDFSLRR